ncbi:hypothetical protein KR222_004701 [Zaprionus bogoriensis]|nr:hypothetical protein KR222_004701 [Zaprionus bogoriensis]
MPPFDDFVYLINQVLLGEEPTIEDFILLVGTFVAFIAFVLWCCFPVQPKVCRPARKYSHPHHTVGVGGGGGVGSANGNVSAATGSGVGSAKRTHRVLYSVTNGTYSKNGTISMHNYYVKSGHHCCT